MVVGGLVSASMVGVNLVGVAGASPVRCVAITVGGFVLGALGGWRRPPRLVLARALDRLSGERDDAIVAATALAAASPARAATPPGASFEELVLARALGVATALKREKKRLGPPLTRVATLGSVLALAVVVTTPGLFRAKGRGGASREAQRADRAPKSPWAGKVNETREKLEALIAEASKRQDTEAHALGAALLETLPRRTEDELSPEQAARLAELTSALARAASHSADLEARLAAAAEQLARAEVAKDDARSALANAEARSLAEHLSDLARAAAAAAATHGAGEKTGPGGGATQPGLSAALAAASAALGRKSDRSAEESSPDRKLERLRRDLDEAAESCLREPTRCQDALDRAAEDSRGLAREKGDPELRRRMAEAASGPKPPPREDGPSRDTRSRAPSDKLSRGEKPTPTDRPATEQASARRGEANGARSSAPAGGEDRTHEGTPEPQGEGKAEGRGAVEESGAPTEEDAPSPGEGTGEGKAQASAPSGSASKTPRTGEAASSAGKALGSSLTTTQEAVVVGSSGQGQTPGAPLSPTTDDGGPHRGRIAGAHEEVDVKDTGVGLSRALTIQGAAAHGLAAPGYRRVFADYAAVADEAVEDTHVSPLHRKLVERYFDVIRPR